MSIDIINLSKNYGKIRILKNVSFIFEDGKNYLIKGENGIGKSTFFKAILKQVKYDGVIRVNGRISYAPDSAIYPSYMEVYSFIDTFVNLIDECEGFEKKTNNLLKEFNIEKLKHSHLGSLSKGEKQKVNLIQALLTPSEILLLDEPLSGLDLEAKKKLIKMIVNDQRTVIVISHETINFRKKDFDFLEIKNGEINVLSKANKDTPNISPIEEEHNSNINIECIEPSIHSNKFKPIK